MSVPFSSEETFFQYFDEDFKSWVDLELGTKILDKSKIKLSTLQPLEPLIGTDKLNFNCSATSASSSCVSDDESDKASIELTVGSLDLE